jgi:hypothetical protein
MNEITARNVIHKRLFEFCVRSQQATISKDQRASNQAAVRLTRHIDPHK